MLQALFGYDALQAGLVLSPGGYTSIGALVVVGFLLARKVDARWPIAIGLLVVAGSNWWMSQLNLEVAPWQVVGPRMMLTGGLGLLFAPLNMAAYKYTPQYLRGAAVGLASLLRNEGGSVGTSMAQTIQERREQFHLLRVGEWVDPYNPNVVDFLARTRDYFYQLTGDRSAARSMALQSLDDLRQQQASSLAYFDVFFIGAVVAVLLVLLVPFMRRSVAEKGEHVGGGE
jgi:DHA2 family multidrug resistance protein